MIHVIANNNVSKLNKDDSYSNTMTSYLLISTSSRINSTSQPDNGDAYSLHL